MYNSSSASRSRVTILFSAKVEEIKSVLSYGVQQDIMSEGFVWLHLDGGIHLEDFADTIPNSRAVAGFLRMSMRPRSERIAIRALHQAIDRSIMWHETIDKFGHFMENHTALECDDCVPWQDKVFAESILQVASTDAATFDWAYDAVWATAIGLVAAQEAGDSDDVTSHIRSGGGKGGFQGASGVVAFHTNGERAALGLTYNLENLQGPVGAGDGRDAWNDLKMQDHIVLLGTYEQSRGFERAIGAVPYWKGGRMDWDAPPDDFADAKVPDTAPTIVERVTIQKGVVETKWWSASALASVVVPTVLGVLVMVCSGWYGYRRCTGTKRDEEIESFVLSLYELRDKLQITRQQGYILSTENTWWSLRSQYVVIPKRQMDAAVHLMRLEDFDTDAFDAFCVLVCADTYEAKISDEFLESTRASFSTRSTDLPVAQMPSGVHFLDVEKNGRGTEQKEKSHSQLLRKWMLSLASASLAELSVIQLQEMNESHTKKRSRKQHNRYFQDKLMGVRIWRDSSCSLFKELQVHVQLYMNKLAGQCHKRVHCMASEPDGHLLAQFRWTPQRGEFFSEQESLHQDGGMCDSNTESSPPPQRQDDERVGAIQTRPQDLLERDMEKENLWLHQSEQMTINSSARSDANGETVCSETVYIAQLHRRALILDRAFKKKIVDSLEQTKDALATDPKPETDVPEALTCSSWTEVPEVELVIQPRDINGRIDRFDKSPDTLYNKSLDTSSDRVRDDRDNLSASGTHKNSLVLLAQGVSSGKVSAPGGWFCAGSVTSNVNSSYSSNSNTIQVRFEHGRQQTVEVQFAPVKRMARMHEKLSKYMPPNVRCQWPLTAYISDVVRLSIVCNGPAQMLHMVRWFLQSQDQTGLTVCRIKNKFLLTEYEAEDGYRDVSLNVLFEVGGLKIIGEIQVHDTQLNQLKSKMHKLYTVKRAKHPSMIM